MTSKQELDRVSIPSAKESVSETDSMVGDKYIVVRKSDYERKLRESEIAAKNAAAVASDVKCLAPPALERAGPLLSTTYPAPSRGMRKGMRLRVWLWQKIAQNQATTAMTTVSALQPGSTPDWSSFSNIYDSARCHGVQVHTRYTDGSNTNGNNTAVTVYDPGVAGTLNSVLNGLEHTHHAGPLVVPNIGSSPTIMGGTTSTGFHVFRGKTVKVLESGLVSDLVGGNWFPTSGTNAIVGYLKPYCENAAAGTVYAVHFVGYDIEFQCRS